MGGRAPEDPGRGWRPPAPSLGAAFAVAGVVFGVLLSNGRPIGAGDTRPTERVAASLVQEGDLDLDEYPEVTAPFARTVGEHRVSIYPVLSGVLAAPLFALARPLLALDEAGTALVGKLAASLFASLAAVALFVAMSYREAMGFRGRESRPLWASVVLVLGTTLWATSQALWQHPAAVLFLSVALACVVMAEFDVAWAGRCGLPLALAAAARHADIALVVVLGVGIALRWPRRIPHLLSWASPGVCFVLLYQWFYFGNPLQHGFSGSLGRFTAPWGVGHLGLLVSPAKGLLVFSPVVLVAVLGLVRAFRGGDRWLSVTLGTGVLAHWLLMGRWAEWHGGESWGPRLMTDALPFLFLFLPEGLAVWPRVGALLAAFSVAVQALGAFAHDYRWERLYQRPPSELHPELWDPSASPILFYASQRVLILARPALDEGRAVVREHRLVLFGPRGSRVGVEGQTLVIAGSDQTLGDVHLTRGARIVDGKVRFRRRWDGLFLRVQQQARARSLEIRIAGRGNGTLYVGEQTFWTKPRWTAYEMTGPFRLRHPYRYAESGGPDITITIGRARGRAEITSVSLLPPGAPETAIGLPNR